MPTVPMFLIAVLAVWRVSHLIVAEDGPGEVIARLRGWADTSWFGAWMDCFGCVSLWVAAVTAPLLAHSWTDGVLLWLGLSGGALLGQRIADAAITGLTARRASHPAAPLDHRADIGAADPRRVPAEFRPAERGWAGQLVASPLVTSDGVQRTVQALADAALEPRPAASTERRRPRPGERREQAATLGAILTDREVPRPASVLPLADRVRPADELFEARRPRPTPPLTDGTVWR